MLSAVGMKCPVCRLLEPKVRESDVQVLDLGPVSRHYKRVVCVSRLLVCRILGVAPRSFVL